MRIGGSVMKPYSSPEEWLKTIKELTASCVIFPVDSSAPVSVQDEYLACIRENGLVIGEVGVWKNVLDADAEKKEANIQYAIRQLELAERIGANCCVNISGTCGAKAWDSYHPSNYSREIYEEMIRVTRRIIDAVNPVNTKYSLEPMPWMVPDSPEAYLKLIGDMDREGFGVHMDYTNMINSIERFHNSKAFIRSCFELLGDRICSVHLKDCALDDYTLPLNIHEVLTGHGALDLADVVRCCEALGPDTTVFTEHLDTHEQYLEAIANVRKAGKAAGVKIL